MRIFQFIQIVVISIIFTMMTNAQSSIVLESSQLKKNDICVFYKIINGALTKGDTVLVTTPGSLQLSSKTPFIQGQYFVEVPKEVHNGIVELLIENNKNSTFTVSFDALYNTVLFKDNPINGVYSAYLGTVKSTEDQIQKLYTKGTAVNITESGKEKINIQIKEQQKKIYDLEISLIKRYPNTLLSAIIKSNNLPLMPGSILENYIVDPKSSNYKEITNFLRENYWKGVDFKSDILLNTMLLPSKAKKYISLFDKNDSQLNEVVKELLDKSAVNPLVYQVISDALYNSFNKPVYIDNDENIAVAILKNAQEQSFVPDWKKQSIEQQILIHQKNMIGSKAVNFTLKDASDTKYVLNDVKSKYTILFFFDPECSHCMEVIPKTKGWFHVDGPKDAHVLAIYINHNEQEWKKYVKENTYPQRWLNLWDKNGEEKIQEKYWIQSLPTIYVLDENKKVILKDVNYKQLINFFSVQNQNR
ncbi:thioredoxin-like domain-containing protein [Flavobacterium sp. Root186]|uniref:thioredoxin-like domain-containing protein n=1 Tax=Flavobacterium sp. Root186 TaxID=1736485 RepID=UPI0009E817A5|nr:thioredoxin-like domain-containing protein [Flavobacterium sp. Root186]